MRLIAWNVNYNNRRRSLEEDVSILKPLNADILILSETAAPKAESSLTAHWIGKSNPGLAIVALNGLQLVPHELNNSAPTLAAAFTVRGRIAFDLLAVWPVVRGADQKYHDILMSGLNLYKGFLSSDRAIMAGDFNSSTRVQFQRKTHPQFVRAADSLGIVSAYHMLTGELHGEESVATYHQHCNPNKQFHIDYCFVSKQLTGSVKLNILKDDEWPELSDHFPLVLDVDDDALQPTLGT